MRRYWFLAVAGAVAAALAIPLSASASASAILSVGSGGPAVASGDALSGTQTVSATFVNSGSSSQKVTCTGSTLAATAGDNPAPTGQATETNSSQAFSGCSISGVFGATGVNSITTNASPSCQWNVVVDDTTSPATVTISPATASGCPTSIIATVSVQTLFGAQTCTYSPTNGNIVGSSAEGSTTLDFSNVSFSKQSGPGTCFGTVLFTESYGITDTTQGGGSVVVN
jgi:hypothetical protein